MISLPERLRKATRDLRTRPIAIADMIPLMLEAADALDKPSEQRFHQNCATCTCVEPEIDDEPDTQHKQTPTQDDKNMVSRTRNRN